MQHWKEWYKEQQRNSTMQVQELMPFVSLKDQAFSSGLIDWDFIRSDAPGNQYTFGHENAGFFQLTGVDVQTGSRELTGWQQPLLKELGSPGVVGIIRSEPINHDAKFLIAARTEPGNGKALEYVLLGPPLQASEANLQARFSAKKPPRAEFFARSQGRTFQPQDGGRFLYKHVQIHEIVISEEELDAMMLLPNERIFTLPELREAIRMGACNSHLVEGLAHILV